MADRFPGGIINKTPPTVSGPTPGASGVASGIWKLDEVLAYVQAGVWPGEALPPPNLYAWGFAASARFFLNTISTGQSSPVQVGTPVRWSEIASDHTTANFLLLSENGGLWATGFNSCGQLGTGNNISVSSPVQVGSLTNWCVISTGGGSTASSTAIRTDNTLWTWGANTFGNLGLGDTTSRNSPNQVAGSWAQVAMGNVLIAVKTDGTIWSAGQNYQGSLGTGGTFDHRSSPTQIGALTNWAYPAAGAANSGAVKTDGTAWAWGGNSRGALGLSTNTTGISSPQQLGALTNWCRLYMGDDNSMFLRSDGNLFMAGYNRCGQLGIGTQGNYTTCNSPVQVLGGAVWAKGSIPRHTAAAIRTDGSLWAWGRGSDGARGDLTTIHRSSPVQVGSDTDWIDVAFDQSTSAGIRNTV